MQIEINICIDINVDTNGERVEKDAIWKVMNIVWRIDQFLNKILKYRKTRRE